MTKIPEVDKGDPLEVSYKSAYKDLLYDYQKQAMEDMFVEPTFNKAITTNRAPPVNTTIVTSTDLIKQMKGLYNSYPSTKFNWQEDYFKSAPVVDKSEKKVEVVMDDGRYESISREELIKYISERHIVRNNEVVRKVYERYQVAVKLVRSDDNGDTGV